jgi:hypothetical protein
MPTRRKEKQIHPKNNHLPMLNGMATQPFVECSGQLLKMALDQDVVDNMVTAVKMSEI